MYHFLILGGNPGSGTSIKDVIKWTKEARAICGDDMLIFAGKWEDGISEKVLVIHLLIMMLKILLAID